jgi:predicted nucleic acid-binding Zn ribbon protein
MAHDNESTKPSKVSDILTAILTDRGWNSIAKEHRVFTEWSEAVGATISDNARPIRINRGVLVVVVSSPVWAQELSLMKDTIIQRLNSRLGEAIVQDIRFIQGEMPGD